MVSRNAESVPGIVYHQLLDVNNEPFGERWMQLRDDVGGFVEIPFDRICFL